MLEHPITTQDITVMVGAYQAIHQPHRHRKLRKYLNTVIHLRLLILVPMDTHHIPLPLETLLEGQRLKITGTIKLQRTTKKLN